MIKTYRFILTGLGNVGRSFLEILPGQEQLLRQRYGVSLNLVGLADSSGAVYAPDGVDLAAVVSHKRAGQRLASLDLPGRRLPDSLALVQQAEADLLLEATPTNLVDGQPGLDLTRIALQRGMHAVLGSKGPLVLAYGQLAALSDLKTRGRPALRFSGAVGGALPTINVGWRDLAGSRVERVEAVLNSTTQIILGLMTQGQSYEAALAEAQRFGVAEPDPSLDVEGWDAANKLVIVANAVLGYPATLADVAITGISEVSQAELQAAHAAGGRLSLLAVAELQPAQPGAYRLQVTPTALPADHPLAHLDLHEMGIVYTSDIYGRLTVTSAQRGPVGAAAAMLRDVLEIVSRHQPAS